MPAANPAVLALTVTVVAPAVALNQPPPDDVSTQIEKFVPCVMMTWTGLGGAAPRSARKPTDCGVKAGAGPGAGSTLKFTIHTTALAGP